MADYKSCFILMPYTKAGSLAKKDLDYIYTHVLKKAVEEFKIEEKQYYQRVERFEGKIGSIISGIVNNLNTADLVIADLTGLNPNVMYELGVRHTLKRGTIIISQDLKKLPSDLRDYLTVGYTYSKKTAEQPDLFEKFKNDLHKTISEIHSTNKFDSPVLNYLQQKQLFRNEEEISIFFENAIIIDIIENEVFEICDIIKQIVELNFEIDNDFEVTQLLNLKLGNLLTMLSELKIPYKSSILYEQVTISRSLLAEVNKIFNLKEYFTGFQGMEGFPVGIFGPSTIQGCLEKQFINVYALSEGKGIQSINMMQLFAENGIIQEELIDFLVDYIQTTTNELGIDESEIKKVLNT